MEAWVFTGQDGPGAYSPEPPETHKLKFYVRGSTKIIVPQARDFSRFLGSSLPLCRLADAALVK